MELQNSQIDISPERELYLANRVAAWIVALESAGLSGEDRAYIEEALPRYQNEQRLIPKIRRGLERSYHSHAA